MRPVSLLARKDLVHALHAAELGAGHRQHPALMMMPMDEEAEHVPRRLGEREGRPKMCCVKVRSPNVQTFFSAHAHLDARSLARRTIGPCASCMPKRPIADANDMSFFGGKKARPSVDDELAAVRSAIMKAIGEKDLATVAKDLATVAMLERRETELKQQQAALERREAEHKQQQAKADYETDKAAHDKIQKPGPIKDAAKSAMDQAHAVYLALLGACFLPWKN